MIIKNLILLFDIYIYITIMIIFMILLFDIYHDYFDDILLYYDYFSWNNYVYIYITVSYSRKRWSRMKQKVLNEFKFKKC